MSVSLAPGSKEYRDGNEVYQYSIINALMAGVAETGITIADLLTKGNIGLGTFQRIKGEMVIVDGTPYRLDGSGGATQVSTDLMLPYAIISNFEPEMSNETDNLDRKAFEEQLKEHSHNHMIVFRVDGFFENVSCRTVQGQTYAGETLASLSGNEQKHHYEQIKGTIVGIYTPPIWEGISVAGAHMHFIDEKRELGGHIIGFQAKKATVQQAMSTSFKIELPKMGTRFDKADLVTDSKALKAAEGSVES